MLGRYSSTFQALEERSTIQELAEEDKMSLWLPSSPKLVLLRLRVGGYGILQQRSLPPSPKPQTVGDSNLLFLSLLTLLITAWTLDVLHTLSQGIKAS